MKKSFTLDTGMKCPYCSEKQYVTAQTRKRSVALNFIPSFSLLLPIFFDITTTTALTILIAAAILIISIYPFYLELTQKEEALW
jgi:CXXC-20-CXXC protein